VFAGAVAALIAAAISAAWLPAHRVAKIDPAIALRHE
jgi:ABC-type antimicrobial peptide transport system permease subunit